MSNRTLGRARLRRGRGYTLVELMMAIALFTVAVLGIVSMQKVASVSNGHAKNLAIAQRIAQSWAAQLQMDSTSWVSTFDASGVLTEPTNVWTRPAYVVGRVGAAFDNTGAALSDSAADLSRARFCTHMRLSWLYGANTGVSGNRVVRAEIRVFWLRDGHGASIDGVAPAVPPTDGLCGANQDAAKVAAIGQAVGSYSFVYQTVGVRQHFQI